MKRALIGSRYRGSKGSLTVLPAPSYFNTLEDPRRLVSSSSRLGQNLLLGTLKSQTTFYHFQIVTSWRGEPVRNYSVDKGGIS